MSIAQKDTESQVTAEKLYLDCLVLETMPLDPLDMQRVKRAKAVIEHYLELRGLANRAEALRVSAEWRRTVGPQ